MYHLLFNILCWPSYVDHPLFNKASYLHHLSYVFHLCVYVPSFVYHLMFTYHSMFTILCLPSFVDDHLSSYVYPHMFTILYWQFYSDHLMLTILCFWTILFLSTVLLVYNPLKCAILRTQSYVYLLMFTILCWPFFVYHLIMFTSLFTSFVYHLIFTILCLPF